MYGRLGIEWAINYGYIQMSMQEQEGGPGHGHLEIAIYPDGHVLPGWKGIANPKAVILKGDRAIRLTPDPRYDLSWGDQPLFKQMQ